MDNAVDRRRVGPFLLSAGAHMFYKAHIFVYGRPLVLPNATPRDNPATGDPS